MPFYEYECPACKFYTEVLQKTQRQAAEEVPVLRQGRVQAAGVGAGIPAQGLGLVRDRFQVGQGRAAQSCGRRAGRARGSGDRGQGQDQADDKAAAKPAADDAEQPKADSPRQIRPSQTRPAAAAQAARSAAADQAGRRRSRRRRHGRSGPPGPRSAGEGGGERPADRAAGAVHARAAALPDQRAADLGAGAGHRAGGALHPAADGPDAAGAAKRAASRRAAGTACAGARRAARPADRAAHRRCWSPISSAGRWSRSARSCSSASPSCARSTAASRVFPRPCCRTPAIPSSECCWCEYPRAGVWSIGFQTTDHLPEINARLGEPQVCVFIPTTPNPTSGFIIFVPHSQCIELDMHVDAAMKMIVTLGVVGPRTGGAAGGAAAAAHRACCLRQRATRPVRRPRGASPRSRSANCTPSRARIRARPSSRSRASGTGRAGCHFTGCATGRLPYPVFVRDAGGATLHDVDGYSYDDFCLGDTGAMFGHSPTPVARALARQAAAGLTAMLPGERVAAIGEALSARFGAAVLADDADRDRRQPLGAAAGARRHRPQRGTGVRRLLPRHRRRDAGVPGGWPAARPRRACAARPAMRPRTRAWSNSMTWRRWLRRSPTARWPPCCASRRSPTWAWCCRSRGFTPQLRRLTREHGTLLIIDETHTLSAGPGGCTRRDAPRA